MNLRKYNDKEVYIMVSLVLRYPDGGHKGKVFWASMLSTFGDNLLEGRTDESLRNKWRKILKEYPGTMEEYKNHLAKALPAEYIEDIDEKMRTAFTKGNVPDPPKNARPSARPIIASKENEEKKTKSSITEIKETIEEEIEDTKEEINDTINLNDLINRKGIDFAKLCEVQDRRELKYKRLVNEENKVVEDEAYLQEEIPLYKKIDEKLMKFAEKYNKSIDYLTEALENASGDFQELESYLEGKAIIPWTELEDVVLEHIEQGVVQDQVLKTRGEEAVNKRKIYLGK